MRGAIGRRLPRHNGYNITSVAKQAPFLIQASSSFSSFSGSGRGRGRGGGDGYPTGPSQFDFTRAPGKQTDSDEPRLESAESPPVGLGHGRGRLIPSDPVLPAFSSFVSSIKPSASPSAGRGRGTARSVGTPTTTAESRQGSPPPQQPEQPPAPPKRPIFVKLQEIKESTQSPESQGNLPSNILSVLGTGAGRGKPEREPGPARKTQEENRHIWGAQPQPPQSDESQASARLKLSREEAVKKAVSILSRGGEAEASGGRGRGRGGRGRGRGRGRGGWRGDRREKEAEEAEALYLGDNADGERFAQKVGTEAMNMLNEGLEEMSERILPSPMEDAFLDAFDTNLKIECEPEYMVEFENPDIDEKPPMPLRDVLEKVKPFLVAYEGIQSQEEWEESVNQVMETVPLLKEIIDHYGGPDRVTAKQQKEELERVAKTIPESSPASVKRFANRAVLTLQSNPGWGFDKKCQFMDKLVGEVSQHYK